MKTLDVIVLTLSIVGGLNWLSVDLSELDLVAVIAGSSATILTKIIYIVVGIYTIHCLELFPMIARKVDERY